MMYDDWVGFDVETDGPTPVDYSLVSVGAALVRDPSVTFYREFAPTGRLHDASTVCIHGLDLPYLRKNGGTLERGAADFLDWLNKHTSRPVMVSQPVSFDGMWASCWLQTLGAIEMRRTTGWPVRFVDARSLWVGMHRGEKKYFDWKKKKEKNRLGVSAPHTHNAMDDAVEIARMTKALMEKGV